MFPQGFNPFALAEMMRQQNQGPSNPQQDVPARVRSAMQFIVHTNNTITDPEPVVSFGYDGKPESEEVQPRDLTAREKETYDVSLETMMRYFQGEICIEPIKDENSTPPLEWTRMPPMRSGLYLFVDAKIMSPHWARVAWVGPDRTIMISGMDEEMAGSLVGMDQGEPLREVADTPEGWWLSSPLPPTPFVPHSISLPGMPGL